MCITYGPIRDRNRDTVTTTITINIITTTIRHGVIDHRMTAIRTPTKECPARTTTAPRFQELESVSGVGQAVRPLAEGASLTGHLTDAESMCKSVASENDGPHSLSIEDGAGWYLPRLVLHWDLSPSRWFSLFPWEAT